MFVPKDFANRWTDIVILYSKASYRSKYEEGNSSQEKTLWEKIYLKIKYRYVTASEIELT